MFLRVGRAFTVRIRATIWLVEVMRLRATLIRVLPLGPWVHPQMESAGCHLP